MKNKVTATILCERAGYTVMGEQPGHVAGFSKAKSTKEPKDELLFIKAQGFQKHGSLDTWLL